MTNATKKNPMACEQLSVNTRQINRYHVCGHVNPHGGGGDHGHGVHGRGCGHGDGYGNDLLLILHH